MIRDRNINWLRRVERIPAWHFTAYGAQHLHTITITGGVATTLPKLYLSADTAAAALAKSTATDRAGITGIQLADAIVGTGAGAPVFSEMFTVNISGLEINAANDSVSHLDLVNPTRWDPREPIGVRVIWAHATGVSLTDAITWRVRHSQYDIGEAVVDGATALDTTIAAQSPVATTSPRIKRSSRGVINANTFDFTSRTGAVCWNVDVSAVSGFTVTAGSSEVYLVALEVDYVPLFCVNQVENKNGLVSQSAG